MGQDRGPFADSADASPAARSTDWTLRGKLRGYFLCRSFSRCRDTAWMLRSICADLTPSMTWAIPRTLRRPLRDLPTGRTPDDSCPRGNLLRGLRDMVVWTLPGCFRDVCACYCVDIHRMLRRLFLWTQREWLPGHRPDTEQTGTGQPPASAPDTTRTVCGHVAGADRAWTGMVRDPGQIATVSWRLPNQGHGQATVADIRGSFRVDIPRPTATNSRTQRP